MLVLHTDNADTDYYSCNLVNRKPKFNEIDANKYLDINTKIAALEVAPSVVALLSYLGNKFFVIVFLVIFKILSSSLF